MRLLAFYMMIVVSTGSHSPAFAESGGNEGGHGGDPYALEFIAIGEAIYRELVGIENTSASLFQRWKFSPASFVKAVRSVRVVSANPEDVILRGQEVAAINNVDLIKINRKRWSEQTLLNRVKLVFHEYLGILKIEQDRYDASLEFSKVLGNTANLLARLNVETINLSYGHVEIMPPLGSIDICSEGSTEFQNGLNVAHRQATSRCTSAGKTTCVLVGQSYRPVISAAVLGLRYCEISVVYK